MAVAGAAVMLAYVGTGSTKLGCGSATVNLTFHLVDDHDGKPIAGAKVELYRDLSAPPIVSAITGPDGHAAIPCTTGCTSYSGPFFRTYRCLDFGEGLRIEAPGYKSVDGLLRDYTSYPLHHNTPAPPAIVVRMEREL